ncbi:MAG: hypothetical protein A2Z13_01385 [Deltaproteobacteria bacterium RBG_16_64_85]|nr:MAG: hypothetical protein A2Z13_01385 [Deltaproteobacteria bacterium RBG_16_64_85]
MEREEQFRRTTGGFFDERVPRAEEELKDISGRPAPTWRAWVISIIAAIVLSVTATLLLGGSFRFPGAAAVSGGCGQGSDCCPIPGNR